MGPTSGWLRQNVELKARLADVEGARRTARDIGAVSQGIDRQRDTYFRVPSGRLKLREIDGQSAALIWYDRPDRTETRLSRYQLVPVDDAEALKKLLDAALTIRCVVDKQRELFLYRNVRIHLDRVEGLGRFLEFEAVLQAGDSPDEAQRLLARLKEEFEIRDADLVATSYGDLLDAAR